MRTQTRSPAWLLACVGILVVACGTPVATTGPAITAPTPPPPSVPVLATPPGPSEPPASSLAPGETAAPSPTLPPIGIVGVECLAGQTVRLHVSITAEAGIPTYALWSTWGGGGDTTRSFPAPYATHIDELVEFTHASKDPEADRIHQFGLAVSLVGVADPIITYAIEPENRCPGH